MKNPFRLLPQGPLAMIPVVLCTMAWISTLVQDGCDFAEVSGPSVEKLTGSDVVPFAEVGRSGYRVPGYYYEPGNEEEGKWTILYTDICSSYGKISIDEDWQWKFSRVSHFITQTLGGSASLFLWCSTFTVVSRGLWRFTAYEMMGASIFTLAGFAWFNTGMCDKSAGNICAFHFGSKADMVAASLWLVASVIAFLKYPLPRPMPVVVDHRDDSETHGMVMGSSGGVGSSRMTSNRTSNTGSDRWT